VTLDPVRFAVLKVAVDDWWGLWELLPDIRAALSAQDQGSDLASAQKVVRQMLSEGLIRLYVRDGPIGKPLIVEPPLSDLLLEGEGSWAAPTAGAAETLVAATEAGEEAYFGGPSGRRTTR
jgi:hypothetical protein